MHIFLAPDNLLHIKRKIGSVVRIFLHIPFCLLHLFRSSVFRRNENLDQLIYHISITVLVLHSEKIHLAVHSVRELRRIDFQGIVHKHFVIYTVRPFIRPDDKPVFIFSEIQPADDAVQFILPLVGFFNGASYFIDEILLKVAHRCLCLLGCLFLIFFQMVAFQSVKKLCVFFVVLCSDGKTSVGILP